MWVIDKYIGRHTYNMDTFNENYFNLDTDMITLMLIPHIEESILYKVVKQYITSIVQIYGNSIAKRKACIGCKRTLR